MSEFLGSVRYNETMYPVLYSDFVINFCLKMKIYSRFIQIEFCTKNYGHPYFFSFTPVTRNKELLGTMCWF